MAADQQQTETPQLRAAVHELMERYGLKCKVGVLKTSELREAIAAAYNRGALDQWNAIIPQVDQYRIQLAQRQERIDELERKLLLR